MLAVLLIDVLYALVVCVFFFKQKTAYEMRISDWSSDVCSSDLLHRRRWRGAARLRRRRRVAVRRLCPREAEGRSLQLAAYSCRPPRSARRWSVGTLIRRRRILSHHRTGPDRGVRNADGGLCHAQRDAGLQARALAEGRCRIVRARDQFDER